MEIEKIQQFGFTGLWIPAEIVFIEDMPWLQKILLSIIYSFSKSKDGCFASNKYLACILGVSDRMVKKYISDLKERGLVRQTSFNGRQRFLETTLEFQSKY